MATGQHVEVRCDLRMQVVEPSTLTLQVAVARTSPVISERLEIRGASGPPTVTEVQADHGGLVHLIEAVPGLLTVEYAARVERVPATPQAPEALDRIEGLRQSRYCPSDLLGALATSELSDDPDPAAIGEWVFERVRYEIGSSGPSDSALDTLLSREGVCRDFAHLVVALARALDVPARFVSVYAPGLFPMDFHAVAEVAGPDGWEIVDGTRLAPRSSLVRIATGRDAADTAFVTVEGRAELEDTQVMAIVAGDLPADDHVARVAIA
jgi:transglutaminase-like putative cysteine protease